MIPTAWRLVLGECRAGHRRYVGLSAGSNYQKILAWSGEGSFEDPGAFERPLGDFLTPTRSGSMLSVVNAVTRDVGLDASDWRVDRLLSMVAALEQEAQQRAAEQ